MVEEALKRRIGTPYRFRDGNWGATVKAYQPGFERTTIRGGDEILMKASNGRRWPMSITWIRWRDSDTAICGTMDLDPDHVVEKCVACENGEGFTLWVLPDGTVGKICGGCNQGPLPGRIGTYDDAVTAGLAKPLNSPCVWIYEEAA